MFDQLFRRHRRELFAFAGRRSGWSDAEDLVQDAYERMLRHVNPDSIGNARAFLFQTVANLATDHHRRELLRRQAHVDRPGHDIGDPWIEKFADATPTPEQALAFRQEIELFRKAILELPVVTRHAFMLNRIEGMPHRDVADRLGISVRSSERHVNAALRHLLRRRDLG